MPTERPLHRRLSRLTERLAVLRLRDLRFVFGATLISSFGDGMVTIALAFAVLGLTHSATDLGIVMAAKTITTVLVSLAGGVVADRVSRRSVMIAADGIRFGGQVAIGILLLSGDATVPEIIGSQVLVSAAGAFFEPASMGLIQAAAGDDLHQANALKVMASSGTGLLGPAVGGVLVATVGSSYALMADGLTYFLSATCLFQVRGAARAAVDRGFEPKSFLQDLRGGLQEVTSRQWLWTTIVCMALGNMLFASYFVLAPLICKQHYGGAPAYATLSILWTLGMLIGGSALLRFKPRFPLRASFIAYLPVIIPPLLLALHAPIYVIGFFQVISGIGLTIDGALWWTVMQEQVPPTAISRVSSYEWAGTLAVMPIGYALIGPLAAAVGISSALIICSLTGLGVTLLAFLVPEIRSLRSGAISSPPVPEASLVDT